MACVIKTNHPGVTRGGHNNNNSDIKTVTEQKRKKTNEMIFINTNILFTIIVVLIPCFLKNILLSSMIVFLSGKR